MARFMIVTFLFLGWAFYELSGGRNFVPPEPEPAPLNALMRAVAEEERLVARGDASPATAPIIRPAAEPVTLAGFDTAPLARVVGEASIPVSPAFTAAEVDAAARDMRAVTGSVVNMRGGPGTQFDVLAQLARGEEAEVLQDLGNGWLQIRVPETGEVGWMVARLMTPVN